MIKALLGELAKSGGNEVLVAAGEHLAGKVKEATDIKKLFVDTGEFFIDYEKNADRLFDDMAEVLSKKNMTKLALEFNGESGYELKNRLLNSLIRIMSQYEIPHEIAYSYANGILYTILGQLPEIAPQKYDRYFQSEWREEQSQTLAEISEKIDKVNSELALCKKRQIEIYTADEMELYIKRQTINPKISIDFFEIDDDAFKQAFDKQRNNTRVYVRAKCKEEAIFCIINELWTLRDSRAIFVVKSKEDWNRLSQISQTNNIYIPWFYDEGIEAIENNTNIFIFTEGLPSFSKEELKLRPRTYHTIVVALERAGMDINASNSLVAETHGLYVPLKKKIFNGAFLKKPEWLEGLPQKIKLTALLVGQWTDSDGDQAIIESLCGIKYCDFMEQVQKYTDAEDPFIHVVNDHSSKRYFLASVENTWDYIDISNDDPLWKQFTRLFVDIINESEKLFTYTTQDRLMAQFRGEKLFWSSNIRSGMIRSLIMKAYYKNDAVCQETLDSLIEEIFNYVNSEERWRYISHFFVDLCEVSPKAVLDRLFKEISESTGLFSLFEKQSDDFIFEDNEYVSILCGIDEFLVQREYASRGFEWLLRLDDGLYEHKSNKLKDTLGKVLCTWCNYSAFKTVEEKIQAAKWALEYDRTAWDIVYEALPNQYASAFGEIHQPRYRQHSETSSVMYTEMYEVVDAYIDLLTKKADFNPGRWNKLLRIAYELSEENRTKVFAAMLYEVSQMSDYEKLQLKDIIRKVIYKHRYFSSATWAMNEEILKEYMALLDGITFATPEYGYEYLFNPGRDGILVDPVPYDEEDKNDKNEEKIDHLLCGSIQEFKDSGLNLQVLAEVCGKNSNSNLGRDLAKYWKKAVLDVEIFRILYNAQESKQMALDYIRGITMQGTEVFPYIIEIDNDLNYDEKFLCGLYEIEAMYNTTGKLAVDKAPDNIKKEFWKTSRYYSKCNIRWALSECKKYGNVGAYLETLFSANEMTPMDPYELYNYIVGIEKMEYSDIEGMNEYYLSEILEKLQDAYEDDMNRSSEIARIEIAFFNLLDWEKMRCFQNEIKRNPEMYAEMVSILYQREGELSREEQDEAQKQYISIIYKLFDKAKFCPAEKDGKVDADELGQWIEQFRTLLMKNNQFHLFGHLLGRLLAFSPVGDDGYMPCEAVRITIEKYADAKMISAYKTTVYNNRGIFTPSAGKEELKMANNFKETADYLAIKYPKTAEIYYGLYQVYLSESSNARECAENGDF